MALPDPECISRMLVQKLPIPLWQASATEIPSLKFSADSNPKLLTSLICERPMKQLYLDGLQYNCR